MFMPMMNVGTMRVRMHEFLMCVRVTVRFIKWSSGGMFVPMMFVVDVEMIVSDWLMPVRMVVALTEMEPDANPHQERGNKHPTRDRFTQKRDRKNRPEKRRGGKVRPRASRPNVAQGKNKQHKTQAVADNADRDRKSTR